mmetsp:Transcript_7459/g.27227  ORF Transcript_7459/g.27227 Transcript_7459/m.27227 type:complete len:86 (+) Transcript_7459:591-848(+)
MCYFNRWALIQVSVGGDVLLYGMYASPTTVVFKSTLSCSSASIAFTTAHSGPRVSDADFAPTFSAPRPEAWSSGWESPDSHCVDK